MIVAFPHRGDAERTQLALRRVDDDCSPRAKRCRTRRERCSPSRRCGVGWCGRRRGVAVSRHSCCPAAARRAQRWPVASAARLERGGSAAGRSRRARRARRRPLLDSTRRRGRGVTTSTCSSRARPPRVPHDQLAKLSRYIGADGRPPALSSWGQGLHTLRSRARAAVRTSSRASCASTRCARRAHAFYSDEEAGLSSSAPSPTTAVPGPAPSRGGARGSHGEQPMDRLICGDVGFGKTEVAMRRPSWSPSRPSGARAGAPPCSAPAATADPS